MIAVSLIVLTASAVSWSVALSVNTSENPSIAVSGVRISWLIFARNSLFARLAAFASSVALLNSSKLGGVL